MARRSATRATEGEEYTDRTTRASLHARRIGSAVLFLLVLSCGHAPDPAADDSGYTHETGELDPVGTIAEGPISSPDLQIDFFRPIDLAVVGDSIYVVDNGNDHIVVLDRDLEALGILGREGEGPGEFQQPVAVRRTAHGIIVSDMGNNRFTELGRDGTVLRTFNAPSGLLSFGVTAAGLAVAPSRDGVHHFSRTDGEVREELGERPVSPAGDEMMSVMAGFRGPSVAVTAGDTVHVFDERTGSLYKYAPTGELRLRKAIPRALRDSAKAHVDRLTGSLAKQGLRVLGSSYTGGIAVMSDGGLFLRIRTDQTFALLIDPETYSVRRINMPVNTQVRRILASARASTVVDSVLYLLRDVSIHAFRLRPAQ